MTLRQADRPGRVVRDWPTAKLIDLGILNDGDWILTTDYAAAGVRLLQVGDIGVRRFIGKSSRFVAEQRCRELRCTFLKPGDILISRMAEPIGRACRLPDLGYSCITAVDVSIWRPRTEHLDPDYAVFYLNSEEWLARVLARASGATRARISRVNLGTLTIPLPPLAEQRRIAAMLTEQMAQLDRARAAAEVQLAAIRALPAAHLRAIFESDEAKGWPTRTLSQITDITAGVTIGRKLPPGTRRVPYMRVANVKDGRLALDDVSLTPATEPEIERARLRYGDLLLTEGGDMDKLGRGDFWRDQLPECIHQNHIFRVRFDLSEFDPRFASAQVGSSYGKRYFAAHAKQTTGIASINRQVLGGFPFLAPPKVVQTKVAESLRSIDVERQGLERAAAERLTAIHRAQAALVSAAFASGPNA